jgi:REP element-mobilizing transposase RayT
MPRRARLDSPGTLHHVIVRGIEKRKIVDDVADRENFVKRMGELAAETRTSIYAWALMKNHAHILLRSAEIGLSGYMRRLLTGYAIFYNRRHQRWGHLFQNRYKSIICEEDAYFTELVRYIHLNPLRVRAVKSLEKLDQYRWSGHATLLGKVENEWQDRDYVLKWFGKSEKVAKKNYRSFVKKGIDKGRRPELVGGGLIRSMGGWSAVKALRQAGEREQFDDRILGSGDFVERMIKDADARVKHQFAVKDQTQDINKFIEKICKSEKISLEELKGGGRRKQLSRARALISLELTKTYGVTLAEVARRLNISTSAVSKIIRRSDR